MPGIATTLLKVRRCSGSWFFGCDVLYDVTRGLPVFLFRVPGPFHDVMVPCLFRLDFNLHGHSAPALIARQPPQFRFGFTRSLSDSNKGRRGACAKTLYHRGKLAPGGVHSVFRPRSSVDRRLQVSSCRHQRWMLSVSALSAQRFRLGFFSFVFIGIGLLYLKFGPRSILVFGFSDGGFGKGLAGRSFGTLAWVNPDRFMVPDYFVSGIAFRDGR